MLSICGASAAAGRPILRRGDQELGRPATLLGRIAVSRGGWRAWRRGVLSRCGRTTPVSPTQTLGRRVEPGRLESAPRRVSVLILGRGHPSRHEPVSRLGCARRRQAGLALREGRLSKRGPRGSAKSAQRDGPLVADPPASFSTDSGLPVDILSRRAMYSAGLAVFLNAGMADLATAHQCPFLPLRAWEANFSCFWLKQPPASRPHELGARAD